MAWKRLSCSEKGKSVVRRYMLVSKKGRAKFLLGKEKKRGGSGRRDGIALVNESSRRTRDILSRGTWGKETKSSVGIMRKRNSGMVKGTVSTTVCQEQSALKLLFPWCFSKTEAVEKEDNQVQIVQTSW